jgi:trigger factor
MKVTLEKLPASQVGFELEVEGQKSQAIYDRAVQKLVKTAEVPGFRKGKAPKQLIIRQFGTTQLKASVLEDLIEESLTQALKEHQDQVKPIGQFQMRSPLEEVVANFEIGKPITFQAAIDVEPVASLKKYQGFEVKAEKAEPKLDSVDQMLHDFQVRRATLIPVEDRPAQSEDVVTVDYTFTDAETNLPIKDADQEDQTFDLGQDSDGDSNIVDAIAGMSIGETKAIPALLDPEYWDEPMAGKSVIYNVTLKEIKTKELPALDDEFAQAISEKQTMVELREFLDQREIDTAAKKTKASVESSLLDALSEELEVEIPETLIDEEVNVLIRQQISYLNSRPDMRGFVNQVFTRENMPQIVETARPEAIIRVKRSIAMAELAKQEKIEAPATEIDERVESVLKELDDVKNIDPARLRSMIETDIINEKVLVWLEQNSQIEFVAEGTLTPDAKSFDQLRDEGLLDPDLSESGNEISPNDPNITREIDVVAEVVTTETEPNSTQTSSEIKNPEISSDSSQPEPKAKSKKAKK